MQTAYFHHLFTCMEARLSDTFRMSTKHVDCTIVYLDDLLNIYNPYFAGIGKQIYPPELQLNKANTSDTEAPFLIYVFLWLTVLFPQTYMINAMTLILIL